MAQVKRDRWEVLRNRVYPTSGVGVIEVGDLLVLTSNKAVSAISITDTSGSVASRLTAVQDAVADIFLGVAMSGKRTDETPNVRVAIDGIFEYPLNTALVADLEMGVAIGIHATDDSVTGTGAPQTVSIDVIAADLIAIVAKKGIIGELLATIYLTGIHALTGRVTE